MNAIKNYFIAKPPGTPDRSLSRSSRHGQPQASTSQGIDAAPPVWSSSSLSWQGSASNPRRSSAGSNAGAAPSICGSDLSRAWMTDAPNEFSDFKADIMVQNLWQDQLRRVYASGYDSEEGVVLKKSKGDWICSPLSLRDEEQGFFEAICQLNVSVSTALFLACGCSLTDGVSVPSRSTPRWSSPSCSGCRPPSLLFRFLMVCTFKFSRICTTFLAATNTISPRLSGIRPSLLCGMIIRRLSCCGQRRSSR